MPTYENKCRSCDHEFTTDQRITDEPVKKCPECGKDEAYRLISQTDFVLNGPGWFRDGY